MPDGPGGSAGPGQPTDPGQPYSRAERLLNLLMALRGTRVGLTREQIRGVVRGYDSSASDQAFERMFERDKDDLRAMGVPVSTLTDASGAVTGYRISGDWTLPPLSLSPAELAVLGLAARMWRRADLAPAALNALRKVEARLGVLSDGPQAAHITGLSIDSPALTTLIDACSRRVAVIFDYRKSGDRPVERRHVHPYALVWWRGHWYLVGHDTDRGQTRVFRASRIIGAVQPNGPEDAFDVPAGFDGRAAVGRFAARDRIAVRIALAPGAGAALRRTGTPVQGEGLPLGMAPLEPGWQVLDLSADDLTAAIAQVLPYGRAARVVAPQEALAERHRQLRAIVAAHRTTPLPASGRAQAVGGARSSGTAQFARLLALVPWLTANSGVSVRDAAAHFGVTVEQLLADLGSVITSGSDDWTLFDIQYWDDSGVIEVLDALDLGTPLSLTPDEGFALVVALDALAAVPGGHDRSAIRSARAALHTALGPVAPAPGTVVVRVDLPHHLVDQIDSALASGRALELTYLGAVRDEVTERVVDPIAVVVVDGYAYLRAWCRTAHALRLFRLDRILDLRISARPAEPVDEASEAIEPMAVSLAATGQRIVIDVPADSAILDRDPVTRRWPLPDGRVRAELPVGDYGWARRLVLGSAGRVVLREPSWLVAQVLEECTTQLRVELGESEADTYAE